MKLTGLAFTCLSAAAGLAATAGLQVACPASVSGSRSGPERPQESWRSVPQAEARHKGKAGLRESPHKPVTKRGGSVHAPWTRAERVPHRGPPGVACRG